jgi:hypothetical protein
MSQNLTMPKLRLMILTVMFTAAGAGFGQMATATQARSQVMSAMSAQSSIAKDVHAIALAKKCTIRRYRRPH